jgi:Kef-type K+ transport system membrane component KefB
MSNHDLSILFFLQLTFILFVIRIVGMLARKIGQPQVVGEIIAGVLMGPSFFGALWPAGQARLFPKPSVTIIYAVSQVGLVLYMFLVGVEFDVELLRRRLRSAAFVSLAGILTPFILGSLLALFMMKNSAFFSSEVTNWEAMLFISAAMSITAFPVLARIIHERGLTGTPLGTLALAAGSMDDAAAWCVLAIALASFSGNLAIVILAIGGGLAYAAFVLSIARPLLNRLEVMAQRQERLSGPMLGFILMLLMLGAWFTDYVGIYAVFGAFILGAAMPRGIVTRDLQRLLDPLTTNFLLPLYFIFSGLNTRLDLLVSAQLIAITLLVILVACLGKGIACWAAARISGENNREAMALGTLMNTRGLMELILLNIGLQHGIITPTLFSIMVSMAVITTLMASPLFELVYRKLPKSKISMAEPATPSPA